MNNQGKSYWKHSTKAPALKKGKGARKPFRQGLTLQGAGFGRFFGAVEHVRQVVLDEWFPAKYEPIPDMQISLLIWSSTLDVLLGARSRGVAHGRLLGFVAILSSVYVVDISIHSNSNSSNTNNYAYIYIYLYISLSLYICIYIYIYIYIHIHT